MDDFMAAAFAEAKASFDEGGRPIGAVLVKDGVLLGRGRNTLAQTGDVTGHAETASHDMPGARDLMESHGIEVVLRHEPECVDPVEAYNRLYPEKRAARAERPPEP